MDSVSGASDPLRLQKVPEHLVGQGRLGWPHSGGSHQEGPEPADSESKDKDALGDRKIRVYIPDSLSSPKASKYFYLRAGQRT